MLLAGICARLTGFPEPEVAPEKAAPEKVGVYTWDEESLLSRSQCTHQSTQGLVAEEKRLELELLDHLREIDRRMLHFEMGYSSLFEFAVRFLGLSEASAYRRIAAMRLVREIPEVKTGLESGSLSLSNVAAAQTFFRAEKKQGKKRSLEEKKEVLKQIEGLSKKDCERKLLEISPETLPREKERALSADLTELKLVFDSETMAMIQELKDRLAHALPQATTSELIQRALVEMLARARDAHTPKFAPVKVESPDEIKPDCFAAKSVITAESPTTHAEANSAAFSEAKPAAAAAPETSPVAHAEVKPVTHAEIKPAAHPKLSPPPKLKPIPPPAQKRSSPPQQLKRSPPPTLR